MGGRSHGGAVIVPVRSAAQPQAASPKPSGNGTDLDEFINDEDFATVSLDAGTEVVPGIVSANLDCDMPLMECDA